MEKYDELEKIRKLKDEGTLTEEEFQKEKGKILNSNSHKIKSASKSKIFFILTIVFVVISFICLINWNSVRNEYSDYMDEHVAADIELKWGGITQSEYENIQENKSELSKEKHVAEIVLTSSIGITVVLLGTAIVLKIKKK